MQLAGVVHIGPDNQTAKGRWYGFGANAMLMPGNKVNPGWANGVYEVDYVKQNGKWKIKKLRWCMIFRATWTEGFIPHERKDNTVQDRPYDKNSPLKPNGEPEETLYASGFICPFHFANPISGRKTFMD